MRLRPGTEAAYAEYVAVNTTETESMRKRDVEIAANLEAKGIKSSGLRSVDYSARVVSYAEAWAELMEARLDAGEKLEDVAEALSRTADTDGITGFMYGMAVSALAQFWEHGEALRRWHNLKTQIGNEGEQANDKGTVLNPALLTVG